MVDMAWPAPAKLNLMLRVIGRRADGYHLLQTVFQFIDLCDELRFTLRDDGRIRRLKPIPGVSESDDLTLRAARLLQQTCAIDRGVDISLEKRLPMGGGLGGGSSNAATVLTALNQLWDCRLTEEQLAELGLQLGADVPVFVRGIAAWAEGIGEALTPITPPEHWYLLLLPGCHVSTAEIFRHPELTRNSVQVKIPDFFFGSRLNDCELLVRRLYPRVDQAMARLGEFAKAQLTGTGATVFAAFDDRATAEDALAQLTGEFDGLVVQGINRSPLLARKEIV